MALHQHPHHLDPEADASIQRHASSKHWFISAVSNPDRYKSRYALLRKFRQHILEDLGGNLLVVECAHGDRQHQVSEEDENWRRKGCYKEVLVRNRTHVWLKECLWGIGLQRLPESAKYITFVDADITFANKHIVTEIVHALQVHKVVQAFETCCDMGPHGEVMQVHRSFGYCHAKGYTYAAGSRDGYSAAGHIKGTGIPWHPGYTLSWRREVLDQMGGLLDMPILGSADQHTCAALVGKAGVSGACCAQLHPNYLKAVAAYEQRAIKYVQGDFGYVRGTILHSWHGKKANRQYQSRWKILERHQFDPEVDITKNVQGVWELTTDKPGLRDDIRLYFSQREEDEVTNS